MSAKDLLNPEAHPPGKGKNTLLLLAVALLTALPLWFYQPEEGEAAFEGADSKAQAQISHIAPDYQPWFQPLLEPASGEIASLLFALQAALGAGVIGYWLGAAVTRERLKKERAAELARDQAQANANANAEKAASMTVDRRPTQNTPHPSTPHPSGAHPASPSGHPPGGDAC